MASYDEVVAVMAGRIDSRTAMFIRSAWREERCSGTFLDQLIDACELSIQRETER